MTVGALRRELVSSEGIRAKLRKGNGKEKKKGNQSQKEEGA